MKNSWKRFWLGGLVLGVSAIALAGCGNKSDDQSASSDTNSSQVKGDIKLWVDTEHIAAIKGQVSKFEKANPDVKVKIKTGSSADALKDVSKDPEKAADVFMMPHDQIGQMAEAGLLYPIGKKQVATIKKNNVDSAIQGVTWKNKVYGYPYGIESQVLYYNKSKLSENDVKSWDSLTQKGKLGANFAENGANYIFAPLFMSNGDVLYGENGEDLKGTNFNNQNGVEVLSWIAKQKSNPGVVQTNAAALANLQSGKIDAFLSGPWSKNDVKKALGDKMAVAAYPTVNFGSGEKQMKAFLGVKVYGVNQQTKSPLASMALANYLSNEKTQEIEFKKNGVVPSNKRAQEATNVKTDAVAKSVMAMSDNDHSVVMPKLPEMTTFWPPMDSLINDVYKGKINATQYQAKLDKFVSDNAKKTK
ncbi:MULTISPECIES: extracellular solute-binding protein [Latilactobacillus]|uniref:extracellular solute-binding protein n=1 Tax=Latilactobacillus TaxID=2767885 RepID=UPI0007EAB6F7|nr:extracellular solute-binding protein [Latilactobacillus curvatus]ANJ68643.1 sugar ABC transporter substrate-binding protein [Latilactobacillus curvatus]ASN62824.1 sugar ABC transporter substrate-binding protein [Latilactobacillus curvatus]AZP97244.1 sugar ABC transporter substrate-binding protein [Latilactobacillus curvatus]MCS8582542.1 extracellular solute-binding protein [Latilactobacillus curvatus]MCS8606186.1 extracellular solute-binding protein [Latilactobacillus curvatus]